MFVFESGTFVVWIRSCVHARVRTRAQARAYKMTPRPVHAPVSMAGISPTQRIVMDRCAVALVEGLGPVQGARPLDLNLVWRPGEGICDLSFTGAVCGRRYVYPVPLAAAITPSEAEIAIHIACLTIALSTSSLRGLRLVR